MDVRETPASLVRTRRAGPFILSGMRFVSRQGEGRQRHARGDNDPLDTVEHIGDGGDAPNRSAGLETPQLLARRRIECIQVAVIIAAEDDAGRR